MTHTMELTSDATPEPRDVATDDRPELRAPSDAEAAGLVGDIQRHLPDAAALHARRDETALRARPAAHQAGALAVAAADQELTFTDVTAKRGDQATPDGEGVHVREAEATEVAAADGRGADNNGDDGDDGDSGARGGTGGEDDRGEEQLRRAYTRFAEDIAGKRAAAESLGEPITVRIVDSADPSGETQYETRFAFPGDAEARAREDARYEALVRARQIADPMAELDLQQIEAYDEGEGQIVTRVQEGKRLNELTDDEKWLITEVEMRGALTTIEAMVQNGIVPSRDYGNTISINPLSNRLQFSDYELLEQTDADPEHPTLTAGEAFMSVMEAFRDPATRGRSEGAGGERIRDVSQHVLRDYYLYAAPHLAYNTEVLDPDAIRTVYANTEPSRSTTAHDLHVASHMHDLALASDADEETRMNLLGNAREAYEISIYQSVLDRRGDIHQVLRVDDRGRNQLLTNDHVLQARLALAFWPASEARVRDEELSDESRGEINRNLATVLGEMMPDGEAPEPSHERQTTHRGFLGEVVAMTALSRINTDEDTSIAIPTSEARRLYAGPDAAVLAVILEEDGDYALDVDWKMSGGEDDPDTVNIGSICARELSKEPGYIERNPDNWRSVVHVARLLHDERLGTRPLEIHEIALLDRVQRAIWNTIETKARDYHGIDNLRDRARF